MRKSRNSVKGEYGIGYAYGDNAIRDFQSLLDSRTSMLDSIELSKPEHKMEFVKSYRGIDFVNDSASVNQNGVYMAFSNTVKSVVWITSFADWNNINVDLLQLIVEKVDMIVYLGECSDESNSFMSALGVRTEHCEDMESAVRVAFYGCSANNEVLFCPGSEAGIEFSGDIAVRGRQFKNAVAQL